MNKISFAAIDIGSNAVRLLIKSIATNPEDGSQSLSEDILIRFPLRLGEDSFANGQISKENAKRLLRLMKAFRQMIKIYDVVEMRACATSAMRDAANGADIVSKIYEETNINIEIIDGEEEARIIYDTHAERMLEPNGDYLYVDVGGGSTQMTMIHGGEMVYSHSYNIGTVRMMKNMVSSNEKTAFSAKLLELHSQYPRLRLIGSGGNINKLHKLSGDKRHKDILPLRTLQILYKELAPMTVEQRMKIFKLRRDRAEVIVNASDIFMEAATLTHSKEIIVPSISISDGIVEALFDKYMAQKPNT